MNLPDTPRELFQLLDDVEALDRYIIGKLLRDYQRCEQHWMVQFVLFGRDLTPEQVIQEVREKFPD